MKKKVLSRVPILSEVYDQLGKRMQPGGRKWQKSFLAAIQPDSDLESVWSRFVEWLLLDPAGIVFQHATRNTQRIARRVVALFSDNSTSEEAWLNISNDASNEHRLLKDEEGESLAVEAADIVERLIWKHLELLEIVQNDDCFFNEPEQDVIQGLARLQPMEALAEALPHRNLDVRTPTNEGLLEQNELARMAAKLLELAGRA